MPTPLYYPPTTNGLQKTLDANLLTGVTASATLNNVTGIQNKKGVMVIDRVDGNNKLTPNKREYISFDGTSGSTVVTLVRGLGGSTDQDHAVGAIVEFVNDITQQQAIIDNLPASLVDAKGDIITASADNTPARLAVGSNGSKLIANSNETTGLQYIAPDGWEPALETWTYASATTITVPSGAASKYKKGDKIKLTQTTVKYFYVVTVADTLLTVTGGSDYTVANATISANYYSHQENPIGFPPNFNCGAFTFDVNTVDNGSGGQPTAGVNIFFIINGRLTIRGAFGGSNVYKVGTNNQIKITALPSTLPANSSLFNVPCGICNASYGGVIIDRDSSSFWFQYSTNINDNTELTYQGWEFSYFI